MKKKNMMFPREPHEKTDHFHRISPGTPPFPPFPPALLGLSPLAATGGVAQVVLSAKLLEALLGVQNR